MFTFRMSHLCCKFCDATSIWWCKLVTEKYLPLLKQNSRFVRRNVIYQKIYYSFGDWNIRCHACLTVMSRPSTTKIWILCQAYFGFGWPDRRNWNFCLGIRTQNNLKSHDELCWGLRNGSNVSNWQRQLIWWLERITRTTEMLQINQKRSIFAFLK